MFGAAKRVLLGVSRCLALQPDHTTLAPELPLPGYRRKETETVFAQLLENTRKKKEGWGGSTLEFDSSIDVFELIDSK